MKRIFLTLLICVLLCGCSANDKNESKVTDLQKNVEESSNMNDDYIILDVRTKEEYESGHINNAVNIPYDSIDKNINLNKKKKIYVYCRSGVRSRKAYQSLKNLGYDVYDLGSYDNAKKSLETK